MADETGIARGSVELTLVMPAYNEGADIAGVVYRAATALRDLGRRFEIVVVDDGSTDETPTILRAAEQTVPELRVVRLRLNAGQHIATVVGLRAARGELVVVADADEQVPPSNIRALVETAFANPQADVIAGARARRNSAAHRDFGSRLVTILVNRLTGSNLSDPATTFRLFRRNTVQDILRADVLAQNVPLLVSFLRAKVVEVPVEVQAEEGRRSRYGFLRLVHVLLLAILNFSAGTTTILSLMALGCLNVLIGTSGLAGVVAAGIVLQHPLRTNWLLFFILIVIVGLQFILVGVVAYKVERINVNLRFRGQLESIHDDPGA
ncbi:glycosyltransferase family 2 protein [Bradyrhizobium sp. 23]|uniref:glycosyltransferase family 2 protein n=1 Tax=Bradyrhizobium sp. 23 TaxID=2782667 RepID=UPI001FF80DB2|nr:glycosyltransferase family 2 protein [Bradyrhizobium sp. 23]MCK1313393.1 glycosyltransferase family 2 protein [Bradyrhizobium sp. 23]